MGHIDYDLPRPDLASRIGDTSIPYCIRDGKRMCYGSVRIAQYAGQLKK